MSKYEEARLFWIQKARDAANRDLCAPRYKKDVLLAAVRDTLDKATMPAESEEGNIYNRKITEKSKEKFDFDEFIVKINSYGFDASTVDEITDEYILEGYLLHDSDIMLREMKIPSFWIAILARAKKLLQERPWIMKKEA